MGGQGIFGTRQGPVGEYSCSKFLQKGGRSQMAARNMAPPSWIPNLKAAGAPLTLAQLGSRFAALDQARDA